MTALGDAEPSTGWPPTGSAALDLARQLVAEWRAISDASRAARASDDPTAHLRLEISGAGRQQMEAARLAAQFAQVSIAEDLHAIRLVLVSADRELSESDVIATARATREHMQSWARGETDHVGEPDEPEG